MVDAGITSEHPRFASIVLWAVTQFQVLAIGTLRDKKPDLALMSMVILFAIEVDTVFFTTVTHLDPGQH